MRRERSACHCLHVCGRICVNESCLWRMHNNDGDVCVVFSWPLVYWRRLPASGMHVRRGLLFCCWGRHIVRWCERIVHIVRGWQLVRGQCRSACFVCVYCGVCVDERDIERMHDNHRDLQCVPRRQLVRRQRGPTSRMHLRRGLLRGCWRCYGLRWYHRLVRYLHRRDFVPWPWCPARVMHLCSGLLFASWCSCELCDHGGVVRNLYVWKLMRG